MEKRTPFEQQVTPVRRIHPLTEWSLGLACVGPFFLLTLLLGLWQIAMFSWLPGLVAVILAHLSLRKIGRSHGVFCGRYMSIIALCLAYGTLAASVAITAIGYKYAIEQGREYECKKRLKGVALLCIMYADEHNDRLPRDLDELKTFEPDLAANIFFCPSAKDQSMPSYELVLQEMPSSTGPSYEELSTVVMIREREANHRGRRAVAYAFGHVTMVRDE